MSAQSGFERLLSVTLTIAAVTMAVAVAARELRPGSTTRNVSLAESRQPELTPNWMSILPSARLVEGDTNAPVTLVEFADLECPACRQFNEVTLPAVRRAFGGKVKVSFVHLPLRIHRFANAAAQASECAATQGRFPAFVALAFAKQDSFGLKSWASFAREAGVRDSAAFHRCVSQDAKAAYVDSGVVIADRLGIHATPTIMLNGWLFPLPPSSAELNRVITELIAGRQPTWPKKNQAEM